MTDQDLQAAVMKIGLDIQKVQELCNSIIDAASKMNEKLTGECYPAVNSVGENWTSGPTVRYVQKVGGTLGDLQDDTASIAAAAGLIYKRYIEDARGRLKSLGVDPHQVFPELY